MGFERVTPPEWCDSLILNCGCEIKDAMILAVMKAVYAIAYIEACKKSGLYWGLNV